MARQGAFSAFTVPAVLILAGVSPITALSAAILEWVPLYHGAAVIILPLAALALLAGWVHPNYGRVALCGLGLGLCAVTLYDCFRVPFVLAGVWGDFIPRIGGWVVDTQQPDLVRGYLYRYLGDGGGLGVSFAVMYPMFNMRLTPHSFGLLYGVVVWTGLIETILFAPHGQELLFPVTSVTLALSLAGHLIYGAVLGFGYEWVTNPSQWPELPGGRCSFDVPWRSSKEV